MNFDYLTMVRVQGSVHRAVEEGGARRLGAHDMANDVLALDGIVKRYGNVTALGPGQLRCRGG